MLEPVQRLSSEIQKRELERNEKGAVAGKDVDFQLFSDQHPSVTGGGDVSSKSCFDACKQMEARKYENKQQQNARTLNAETEQCYQELCRNNNGRTTTPKRASKKVSSQGIIQDIKDLKDLRNGRTAHENGGDFVKAQSRGRTPTIVFKDPTLTPNSRAKRSRLTQLQLGSDQFLNMLGGRDTMGDNSERHRSPFEKRSLPSFNFMDNPTEERHINKRWGNRLGKRMEGMFGEVDETYSGSDDNQGTEEGGGSYEGPVNQGAVEMVRDENVEEFVKRRSGSLCLEAHCKSFMQGSQAELVRCGQRNCHGRRKRGRLMLNSY